MLIGSLSSPPQGNAPQTIFELIALLRLSRQWLSPNIASWSIHQLDARIDTLGPGLALKLSSEFRTFAEDGITWINRSVRAFLARGQARRISRLERDQMGPDAYAILVNALETMAEKLKMVAAQAPGIDVSYSTSFPIPCSISRHQKECCELYGDFWWKVIARKLLLPDSPQGSTLQLNRKIPYSIEGFRDIKLLIESNIPVRQSSVVFPGSKEKTLAPGCRVKFLAEAEKLFEIPETITVAAVTAVQALYELDTMDLNA